MSVEYEVRLKTFKGPLDLLLHLIEKNKIDIYDIPVAVLTKQYLTYMEDIRRFDIEIATEFLVMAAELLQLKSRMMLPRQKGLDEDNDEEEDPRQELVERLLEYRRYKKVSNVLGEMAKSQEKVFYRSGKLAPIRYLPPENMNVRLLWRAFQNAMEGQLSKPVVRHVARDEYSVQDKMLFIISLLSKKDTKSISFAEAFMGSIPELIASFLAMLELIKLQRITIKQDYSFSPIYIYLRE